MRSTEARHGSPSHRDSLGCFQKMQKEQSQVLHKAGLDLITEAAINTHEFLPPPGF